MVQEKRQRIRRYLKARAELELYFSAMPKHGEIALCALRRLDEQDFDGFEAELKRFDLGILNNVEALRTVVYFCKKHDIRRSA